MVLSELGWKDVDALSREVVVLIPTGSLEQHGPALPVSTDTLIVTAIAEAVEKRLPKKVLLTPTLWLGASGHHLGFAGTLSSRFDAYIAQIESIVDSLSPHGFHKFYVVNGHGGNESPNDIAVRNLKVRYPEALFGRAGYFPFCEKAIAAVSEGPLKEMHHSCEAETSLVMHLRPDLVKTDQLRNDGLAPETPLVGAVHHFDEITEQGSYGYAPLATAKKGQIIFEAAVKGLVQELEVFADGYVLRGIVGP